MRGGQKRLTDAATENSLNLENQNVMDQWNLKDFEEISSGSDHESVDFFYICDIVCSLYGSHITFAHSYTRMFYYKVKLTL